MQIDKKNLSEEIRKCRSIFFKSLFNEKLAAYSWKFRRYEFVYE